MKAIFSELLGPSGLVLLTAIVSGLGAFWVAVQQSKSSQALEAKNKKIEELQERISDLITGGDSFCYFQIGAFAPGANRGILMAIHHGDYPVYDVKARMVDLQNFEQKKISN